MAQFYGAILGVAAAAMAGATGSFTDPFFCNGRVARVLRDFWTGNAAQNDTVVLGTVDWETRFDAISAIDHTDFGTAIALDVGVANDPDCLIAAHDVATAAGQVGLLKSVPIDKRHLPLWQLAGYATKADAKKVAPRAEIYATLKGGDPDAGTLSWAVYGSPQ